MSQKSTVIPPKISDIHNRLQNELPYYSRHALIIKDKQGNLIPFVFNKAQEYIHQKLEEQLRLTGKVRALILKGRQQGCSTYVAARYQHKTSRIKGKSCFILSHESDTTKKLYAMVERFQNHTPPPLKTPAEIQNRRQLIFANGSDYSVGTAGNVNVGRGGTIQYFHGSEIACWEKTDEIETGIMQSIPDMEGTESILESTAKGVGNMFYVKCMDSLQGIGDYILIFVPWYWQLEYRKDIPREFQLTDKEVKLKEHFQLDNEQIYWRRKKMEGLRTEWKFKQEYPMTVQEAFVTSGDALIKSEMIMQARKLNLVDTHAPVIMGVDPARKNDRTIISFRRGREFMFYKRFDEMKDPRLAGIIANDIERYKVVKCFIDITKGYGALDILEDLGYKDIVQGVHFNEEALNSDVFLNKRAEILVAVRDWLHGGGVSIPDDEELQVDLLSTPDYRTTTKNLIFIIPKVEIKKKFGRSPDIYDSFALTFAYPVKRDILKSRTFVKKVTGSRGPLTTLNRHRGFKADVATGVNIWGS